MHPWETEENAGSYNAMVTVFTSGYCCSGAFTHLSPDAGLFKATERSGGVEDMEAVHPDCTGFDVVCNRVRLADIPRPNRSRETVRGVVCTLNYLIEVAEFNDAHYGPEYLFPCDLHFILDIGKHRRFDKEALISN